MCARGACAGRYKVCVPCRLPTSYSLRTPHLRPLPSAPVLTTRPQPWSIMPGSAALVAWKVALRHTSMTGGGGGGGGGWGVHHMGGGVA